MRPMLHQTESINKEKEITMMSQVEILEFKDVTTRMKNLLERFNSSFLLAEKRTHKHNSKLAEIIQSEQQKVERKER